MMRVITDPVEADLYHREGLLYFKNLSGGSNLKWILDSPLHNPPSEIMTARPPLSNQYEFAIQLEE